MDFNGVFSDALDPAKKFGVQKGDDRIGIRLVAMRFRARSLTRERAREIG
jgi:hypothetical protein